jgi:hypothetical protein
MDRNRATGCNDGCNEPLFMTLNIDINTQPRLSHVQIRSAKDIKYVRSNKDTTFAISLNETKQEYSPQ